MAIVLGLPLTPPYHPRPICRPVANPAAPQAQQFMQSVTQRLQKSHTLMASKDSLLTDLSQRLHATANALKAQETAAAVLKSEMGREKTTSQATALYIPLLLSSPVQQPVLYLTPSPLWTQSNPTLPHSLPLSP